MKTIRFFSALLTIVTVTLAFTACGGNDDEPDEPASAYPGKFNLQIGLTPAMFDYLELEVRYSAQPNTAATTTKIVTLTDVNAAPVVNGKHTVQFTSGEAKWYPAAFAYGVQLRLKQGVTIDPDVSVPVTVSTTLAYNLNNGTYKSKSGNVSSTVKGSQLTDFIRRFNASNGAYSATVSVDASGNISLY